MCDAEVRCQLHQNLHDRIIDGSPEGTSKEVLAQLFALSCIGCGECYPKTPLVTLPALVAFLGAARLPAAAGSSSRWQCTNCLMRLVFSATPAPVTASGRARLRHFSKVNCYHLVGAALGDSKPFQIISLPADGLPTAEPIEYRSAYYTKYVETRDVCVQAAYYRHKPLPRTASMAVDRYIENPDID